ncbi:MAG: DNA polymerase III subunit chi [Gammaproteobacteria bacterium]|nr:DNA polymerase III subunit chi [Gammaproteobacteria bacterium]
MTEASFYILQSSQSNARYVLACRIAEKAYKLDQQVFILTGSDELTVMIDNLLWSFRQGSFIPHLTQSALIQNNQTQLPNTVVIGTDCTRTDAGVLINLSEQLPEKIDTFQRIAEIVDQNAQVIQAGRERYKAYQSKNISLTTHHL